MGLSSLKGNSGYIGIDKRNEVSSTGTTGNVSIKKYYLERLSGNFAPIVGNLLFEDDFEDGTLNKWSVANEGGSGSFKSDWEVGTNVVSASGGTYSAYISDDNGVTAQYYGSSQRDSHIYFDFDVPANAVSLTLQFDWRCNGESSFDHGYVNYWNTTSTPLAGIEYTSTTDRLGGDANGRFNDLYQPGADLNWFTEVINIDGTIGNGPLFSPGNTQRIVFSWTNDSSVENNPGFCIDNVKLTFNT
jgi:hypothetical protein